MLVILSGEYFWKLEAHHKLYCEGAEASKKFQENTCTQVLKSKIAAMSFHLSARFCLTLECMS